MTEKALLEDLTVPASAAGYLRTTRVVRERAGGLLARARAGLSDWFAIDDTKLDAVADEVVKVTRERYPDLKIPYHSRWRHFEAGGEDRRAQLDQLLGDASAAEKARAHIDLALVSVLLDAGAGPDWKYVESSTGKTFARSEGLGVASYHAFIAGAFSSDPANPYRADSKGLRGVITERLGQAFQVRDNNPLVGLEGRATLLRRLGEVLAEQPETYGGEGRPGGIFDTLTGLIGTDAPPTAELQVHDLLSTLLMTLSGIWPAQNHIGTEPLGDCWPHSCVPGDGLTKGWMPFHKLSQWLTYSLLEPFEWAGVKVHGLDALTGLPEYRNGGLLVDAGVIRLKDLQHASRTWQAGDEFIVEWRALTVALLDEIAPLVRKQLKLTEAGMPLACVLEGGTWAAGRVLAQRLRGGTPPFMIESDGTVF
ncbi:URC4/urg3 family protein [Variovorax sp. VNK109]|uniref:URC4/urg3 family protein n=1 Tax=Variovorax sp. VNK109 TaxID=3400919 RepID=UPI003C003B78